MGKFVGAIVGAIMVTVGVLVPGAQGLIAPGIGMIVTNAVTLLFAPSAPKPDAATTQKKEPTPVRTRGIGTRRVYGKVMLYETAANDTVVLGIPTPSSGATVDVLAFLDGRSHAARQVYLNDDKVTLTDGVVQELEDGRYKTGKVLAGFNLGLPTETAFAPVIATLPDIWTEDHRGDGITSGYLIKKPAKDKAFLETYPQADQVVMSAVFDMAYLFDPRDGSMDPYNPETWVKDDPLLDNPALGLLWYLLTDRGVDYDTQIAPVVDYWIAAADHCDELVPLRDSGTERCYRCCILYDLSVEPAQVIGELLKTFDGWYSQDALGRYVVYSGQYYEPTVTIGPAQIVNARHQGYVEEEDYFNELTVTYISAEHDYNEVDTTPWRDESGDENSTGFAPQVPSHSQARRLAKRVMARQNAPDRGTITTNYSGMAAIGQRFIMLEHVEAGATFYSGPAEIVTSPEKDMQTLGITFDWVAVDPNIDAWNPATEEGEPAPVGDRVAPQPVATPAITDATFTDGTLTINATGPNREDLTWYARTRQQGASLWGPETTYTDVDAGDAVVLETDIAPTADAIELQVAYVVGDGRRSDWSALFTVTDAEVVYDGGGAAG